jgi:hypothetical protein
MIEILSFYTLPSEIRSDYIPLKIWQTYKTDQLPEKAKECQLTWKDQPNYHYHFMDDAQIDQFMKKHFSSDIYKTFNSLPMGVMKADMWRYCVLYVHGGIYTDIDSIALQPLEDWKIQESDRIIIALENDLHFCQWTILAEPGHPILKKVIDLIVKEAKNGIDTSTEHFVHKHTGPGIWSRAVQLTLGFPEYQSASDTYKLYLTNKDKSDSVFQKLGVRIENDQYFAGEKVKNLYGSTQFGDGYVSWMDERDKIISAEKSTTK